MRAADGGGKGESVTAKTEICGVCRWWAFGDGDTLALLPDNLRRRVDFAAQSGRGVCVLLTANATQRDSSHETAATYSCAAFSRWRSD